MVKLTYSDSERGCLPILAKAYVGGGITSNGLSGDHLSSGPISVASMIR